MFFKIVNHSSRTCQKKYYFVPLIPYLSCSFGYSEKSCCYIASQTPKVICHQFTCPSSPPPHQCSSAPLFVCPVIKSGAPLWMFADSFQMPPLLSLLCHLWVGGKKAWVLPPSVRSECSNHASSGFPKPFPDLLGRLICSSQKAHYVSDKPFPTSVVCLCYYQFQHPNRILGGMMSPYHFCRVATTLQNPSHFTA